jgi:hypothetical protein
MGAAENAAKRAFYTTKYGIGGVEKVCAYLVLRSSRASVFSPEPRHEQAFV